MSDYSLEPKFIIWDNEVGDKLEVGFDDDGIGLIQICSYTTDGKVDARMVFDKEQIPLLINALTYVNNFNKENT
jgi:hypothetical protein